MSQREQEDKLRLKLEEFEAQQLRKAKRFDPKQLTVDGRKTKTIRNAEFGIISYKPLTYKDLARLNEIQDSTERTREILFAMLKPCYPSLAKEDIDDWAIEKVGSLLILLFSQEDFLSLQKNLQNGLQPQLNPRT